MTLRVEWWHDLHSSVICEASVAGQQISSLIADRSILVHFPALAADPSDFTLSVPPDISAPGLRAEPDRPPDYWGLQASSSGGKPESLWVYRVVLTADIECTESELSTAAGEIDVAMDDWWDLARSWLEAVTGQRLTPVGHIVTRGSRTPFWQIPADGSKASLVGIRFKYAAPYDSTPMASIDVLRRCFDLAASGESFPVAWSLLRDARSLDNSGHFRRAIIDAGAAAEISMKVLIERTLPSDLAPRVIKRLTGGTLGTLWSVLLEAGYVTSLNLKDDLIRVRNLATHMDSGGHTVTGAESATAIAVAARLVEDAHPLPGGLTRLWQ